MVATEYKLCKMKITQIESCAYCNQQETVQHIRYDCEKSVKIWKNTEKWIKRIGFEDYTLETKEIILGEPKKIYTLMDSIIMTVKMTISTPKKLKWLLEIYFRLISTGQKLMRNYSHFLVFGTQCIPNFSILSHNFAKPNLFDKSFTLLLMYFFFNATVSLIPLFRITIPSGLFFYFCDIAKHICTVNIHCLPSS